jgi:hypothetical protein
MVRSACVMAWRSVLKKRVLKTAGFTDIQAVESKQAPLRWVSVIAGDRRTLIMYVLVATNSSRSASTAVGTAGVGSELGLVLSERRKRHLATT